jgi:hypothetical protein
MSMLRLLQHKRASPTLKMEAAGSFETSVSNYQITWHYIPENRTAQTKLNYYVQCRELDKRNT